jgi:tetratricopeptide (TPR) repeat protein
MLAFRDTEAILAEPEPAPDWALARAFRLYARGVAHAARGAVEMAEQERRSFEAAVAAVPAEDRFLINNSAADFLAVAAAVLDAEIAAARGETDRALEAWQRAVDRQAALQYDEPPPWYEPVAQRQAFALLRAGRPAEAEAVFRRALEARPRDGRLLFGLWQSLQEQGRKGDARLVETRFHAAWGPAGAPLEVGDL